MVTHLKTHSTYSSYPSIFHPKDIVSYAKSYNMSAIAICDLFSLSGSLEFALEAIKNQIHPIIGVTLRFGLSITKLQHNTKNFSTEENFISKILLSDNSYEHFFLSLYAQNEVGYKNLLHLSSLYEEDKFINFHELQKHSDGILILSGGANGAIEKFLLNNKDEIANNIAKILISEFNSRFYIEIARVEDIRTFIEDKLLDIASQYEIPILAVNDVNYGKKEQYDAIDAAICIRNSTYLVENDREKGNPESYFKSFSDMEKLFSNLPEALENISHFIQRCSYSPQLSDPMLPKFSDNEEEEFLEKSYTGLKKRIGHILKEDQKIYWERLDYEISVISRMQYVGYFLIVADFIAWAKDNAIPVGPGRGSGSGSVVAWALQITDLDPIEFGLFFERFLNPDRVSMPDFDIDFCQERRDEVISYVKKKYGDERVAQIITFGKFQPRAVIRDIGRIMQIPYGKVDSISKMVPFNPVRPLTLSEAIDVNKELYDLQKSDADVANIIAIGLQLEGLIRHKSVHAAGVIIAATPVVDIAPVFIDSNNTYTTQYSMKYAEMSGLVKFDFLGLKTLTLIDKTISLVSCYDDLDIDITNIPRDDLATFTLLATGRTTGIFQFESGGIQSVIQQLKPDQLTDIIALGALYRPGPMDNIPTYIKRKRGEENVEYIDERLKVSLEETFGIIVYQEQVMQIAQILASYTLGEADLLRRAMGKKNRAEMEMHEEKFISGAIKNGIAKAKAKEIFALLDKFAEYGFNKAHAVAYGIISYYTAYLKANHIVEFLVSSMNLEIDDTDKICIFINEARYFNVKILPPNINFSMANFSIEIHDNIKHIRYGLNAIKNVSSKSVEDIITSKNEDGHYKNLIDFMKRNSFHLNKKTYESLVLSGCFDDIQTNRAEMVNNFLLITSSIVKIQQDQKSQQLSIFDIENDYNAYENIRLIKTKEYDFKTQIMLEYKAIGFYLINHPMDKYDFLYRNSKISTIADINSSKDLAFANMFGVITNMDIKFSRKVGNRTRYALITFSDVTGLLELSCFEDDIIDRARDYHKAFSLVKISINVSTKGDTQRLLLSGIEPLPLSKFRRVTITIPDISKVSKEILHIIALECKKNDETYDDLFWEIGSKGEVTRVYSGKYAIRDLSVIENHAGISVRVESV